MLIRIPTHSAPNDIHTTVIRYNIYFRKFTNKLKFMKFSLEILDADLKKLLTNSHPHLIFCLKKV